MPLLTFKAQFADRVESGVKRQTIRRPRKDGRDPAPGDLIHLYTGLRTRTSRKLGVGVCIDVRPVVITSEIAIRLDGMYLSGVARNELVRADGFDTCQAFVEFFKKAYGLPFEGLVIRWKLQEPVSCAS